MEEAESAKCSFVFTKMTISEGDDLHKLKFLDEVRRALRLRHYSIRTEQTYLDRIRQFILVHRKRHPHEMGEVESARFSRI